MNPHELRELLQRAPLPIIIALILYFAAEAIVGPVDMQRQQADSELRSLTNQLRQTRQQESNLDQINRGNTRLLADLQRIQAWLPPRAALPEIIDQLHRFAGTVGLKVLAVRYAKPEREGSTGPDQLVLDLELAGSYAAVHSFITVCEGLPFPVFPLDLTAHKEGRYSLRLLEPFRAQ